MKTRFDLFQKNKVSAKSVADFLDRYYKQDRYIGRGQEYAETLLASHEQEFREYGVDFISCHESVTGQIVAYYGDICD